MVGLVSDFIAIRRIDIKPKSKYIEVISSNRDAGAVLQPENFEEHPFQGDVVAVGPGFILSDGKRKKMCCRVGDRVLYKPNASMKYEWVVIDGEVLMLMRDSDIIGVIT